MASQAHVWKACFLAGGELGYFDRPLHLQSLPPPHPQPTLSSSRCEIPTSRHQVIELLQEGKFSEKEANLEDELYCKGEPRGQEGRYDGTLR